MLTSEKCLPAKWLGAAHASAEVPAAGTICSSPARMPSFVYAALTSQIVWLLFRCIDSGFLVLPIAQMFGNLMICSSTDPPIRSLFSATRGLSKSVRMLLISLLNKPSVSSVELALRRSGNSTSLLYLTSISRSFDIECIPSTASKRLKPRYKYSMYCLC